MSLKIVGEFSIGDNYNYDSTSSTYTTPTSPKYQIHPHEGFEIVKAPNGQIVKLAYGKMYPAATPDLEIELMNIYQVEKKIDSIKLSRNRRARLPKLKFHYKKALSLMCPSIAGGWNRWSDNILDLFIIDKVHKILWGSGNCGKSAVMAALLYTKWRVNPNQRMVVIASRVVKDASARVYGYIKNIHVGSPGSSRYDFKLVDGFNNKGIYCLKWDEKEQKHVINDQACIVNLPVKVNAETAEMGANLLGKHPEDRLILAFDEAQELPSTMLSDKIFLNWYTNERLDVYAWGNPNPVNFTTPEKWDLLFKMGAGELSREALKKKEKKAPKTDTWHWNDTFVLRFTMLDSPKDDADEVTCWVDRGDGTQVQRLWFLAGKENVDRIAAKVSPNTPAWYSQVLGFPYMKTDAAEALGVVSPMMIKQCNMYPLVWKAGAYPEYFMGVDPAASGKYDAASIVVCKMAKMDDGRMGVDLMKGEGCVQVELRDSQDFIDSTVETMWSLAQRYSIPLKNVAIETHSVGEAVRYAVMRNIEDKGMWTEDYNEGQKFHIVSPVGKCSERMMFRALGKAVKANEVVTDINTELWYAMRCLYLTRQIFNVPEVINQQLMQRHIEYYAGKYKLEKKASMKNRGIQSPNDADALSNAIDLMRNRGLVYEYYDKPGYSPLHSQIRRQQRAEARTDAALGVVSNMLALGTNLGRHSGNKKRSRIQAVDNI